MRERERKTERQRDRQRDRETDIHTQEMSCMMLGARACSADNNSTHMHTPLDRVIAVIEKKEKKKKNQK